MIQLNKPKSYRGPIVLLVLGTLILGVGCEVITATDWHHGTGAIVVGVVLLVASFLYYIAVDDEEPS